MELPHANGEFEKGLEKYEVLVTHREPCPEGKVLHSTKCSSSSTEGQSSDENKGVRTGEKPFVCDVCSASFKFKSDFERLLLKHIDDRPFQCTQCSLSFKSKERLHKHKRSHRDERPFPCTKCIRRFKFKYNQEASKRLELHWRRIESNLDGLD